MNGFSCSPEVRNSAKSIKLKRDLISVNGILYSQLYMRLAKSTLNQRSLLLPSKHNDQTEKILRLSSLPPLNTNTAIELAIYSKTHFSSRAEAYKRVSNYRPKDPDNLDDPNTYAHP